MTDDGCVFFPGAVLPRIPVHGILIEHTHRPVEESCQFDSPARSTFHGAVCHDFSHRYHLKTFVDHMENNPDYFSDFLGMGIPSSHAFGNNLHADITTFQFLIT